MVLRNSIVKKIKELRLQGNMSQEDLAEISGLDRTYISSVERESRNITIDSLEKIIKGLGVTIKDFFEGIK